MKIEIHLSSRMYDELLRAINQLVPDPADLRPQQLRVEDFARECVESVLAERRLDRIAS